MASVTKNDIPEIAAFDAAFWEMKKKFWIPEIDNQGYWDDFWEAAGEIKKKFPHPYTSFAVDAFGNYLLFMYELAKREGKK